MTLEDIEKEVDKIRSIAWDSEVAHGEEDRLYANFVQHIAETGDKNQQEMANAVLETKNFKFSRWAR